MLGSILKTPFTFLQPGKLVDKDLDLVLTRTVEADHTKDRVLGRARMPVSESGQNRYTGDGGET
jgi:hypothetical protein